MGFQKIYLHNYLLTMLITDLQYFGSISFIKELIQVDTVNFDHEAPFSKMSFKNRMIIASAQGPLHLTIPIVGGRDQKTALDQIEISYETPWNEQHYKSIVTCYQRSPYFEYYQDSLSNLYQSKPQKLLDFLLNCHLWIQQQLKGKWVIQPKDDIHQESLLNGQRHYHPWLPKNFDRIPNPIKYQQVFEDKVGFIPNLSILDILFCVGGKQTPNYLKAVNNLI